MTAMNRRLPLLLLLTFATPLAAQDDEPPGDEAEVRRYAVEMIIFRYNEDVSTGSEVFIPDPPPEPAEEFVFGDGLETESEPVGEDQLLPAEEPGLLEEEIVVDEEKARKYEFVMLGDDEFTMLEAWEHLERLDVYEPVMHFAWTQPTLPEDDTEARPLSSFATPPEGLNGELKLYLGRYLHLVVDLALAAPEEPTTSYTPYRNQDNRRLVDALTYDNDAHRQETWYRIQEDRIFKSGDIRYFDHPKFGVLAKITRVEEQEVDEEFEEFLGDPALVGG